MKKIIRFFQVVAFIALLTFHRDIETPARIRFGHTYRAKRKGLALLIMRLRAFPVLLKAKAGGSVEDFVARGMPAIQGAADPYVTQAAGIFTGTVGSTAMVAGDLVYFDGTDWELADASDNTKYAEAIATNSYESGDTGAAFCTSGIIVDTDAPYTQGDQYYLSETAGAITATRPTTAASLRQLVGFGLSTTELRTEIKMPTEHHMSYNFQSNTAAESAIQLDTGDFIASYTNADDEDIGAAFATPQNAVGVEYASLFTAAEAVTGPTDYDITISGATDGEQWDATTADSTLASQVVSGAVADEIQRTTMTTGFDAAGVIEPDNVVGVHAVHDGGQTDVLLALALEVVWLVV